MKSFLKWKYIYLCCVLVLILSCGIFLSINPMAGWYALAKLFEYVLLGLALKQWLIDKHHRFLVAMALSAGILYESILAIGQDIMQRSIGGAWYLLGERLFNASTPGIANASVNGQLLLRPYGTLPHPNVLAAYLLLAIIWINIEMHQVRHITQKILFLCVCALGSFALLVSLSRAAISIWVVSTIMGFSIFLKQKIQVPLLVTIPMLSVSSGIIFLLTPLHSRFIFSLSDESLVLRSALIQAAWRMFIAHPAFGVGFANYLPNLPFNLNVISSVSVLQPVHNIFFLVLAETGIPGIIFVGWFLYQTYNHVYNNYKMRLVPLTIIVLLSMVDHYLFTLQQGQLLLVFILSYCWADK